MIETLAIIQKVLGSSPDSDFNAHSVSYSIKRDQVWLKVNLELILICSLQRLTEATLWFNILSVYCSTFYQFMIEPTQPRSSWLNQSTYCWKRFHHHMVAAIVTPKIGSTQHQIFNSASRNVFVNVKNLLFSEVYESSFPKWLQ